MKLLGINIKPISYSTFDRIGEFYNSLAAVIIGNLFFVGYRFFEVDTLFSKYLVKAEMDPGAVTIASKFIAVVVIFTMLLIAVNRDRFKYARGAEILGFLITLFINLFFWDVWSTQSLDELVFKWGISLITSSFDVAFAHLFIKKWLEQQRRSKAERSISALEQEASKKRADLSRIEGSISTHKKMLLDINSKVNQSLADIKKRTCPKCKAEFSSVNAKNGHMRTCKVGD